MGHKEGDRMTTYSVIVKSDDGTYEKVIGEGLNQRQANDRFATGMNRFDMKRVHILIKDEESGVYVTFPVGEKL